jgi:pyridoxal phosphate-dependent aminotransferase EpsN
MSNIVAAIGRAQLRVLDDRVTTRRRTFDRYVELLADLPGIEFMPEAPYGRATRWLTCLTVDPAAAGATTDEIRLALEDEDIEARPVWKPMHLQPLFRNERVRGGRVAHDLFTHGLCLPSGSDLSVDQIDRIANVVKETVTRT